MDFDIVTVLNYIGGRYEPPPKEKPALLAYIDQVVAACDEMAGHVPGKEWDGSVPMPFPRTRGTYENLFKRAFGDYSSKERCEHIDITTFIEPTPIFYVPSPVTTGPHALYCETCVPEVMSDAWADLPRGTVRAMVCDACGKHKFKDGRDIWPVVPNLLQWAVLARCCFDCRNIFVYNRQDAWTG